ncbi:MAG TPA: sigma-70 family RNA polymerase sigma factor [Vicinamibacterales bacterium]|nr:sigma-70 family RNA polymerase sigma factor [Vicinamibacterales bacterium]
MAADPKAEYAALVRDAATGDRDAMERLLMRAQEVAYRFSLLVCGHPEDAEDVMQEALLKTYEHASRIAEPEAFRTWLYSTVRRACLMKRRRRVGEPARFDPLDPMCAADPATPADQRLIDASIDAQLQEALNMLAPRLRTIVVMRELEGLSTKEVAEVTGLSEANVKQRLHRARAVLRRELAGAVSIPTTVEQRAHADAKRLLEGR